MSSPTTRTRDVDEDYDEDSILERERARLKNNTAGGDEDEEDEEDGDFEGGGDEDDDGEDDDGEEEEDAEETGRPRKRSKHKRSAASRFLDIEAEVSEDEGDEEDDEADLGEYRNFIAENDEVPDSAAARRAHLDFQRFERRERAIQDVEATKLAEEIKNRYRQSAMRYTGDLDQVPQRLLMPSVNDPSLWQVRVRPGRERDIVFALIRKARDLEYTNHPIEIMSAFERSSLPGMIYVEARSAAHVRAAVNGLVGVFVSSPINLVPIEEMASLLRIKKKEINVDVGSWVRIKRGRYQGDLAQVVDVIEPGERYMIKFIPRIDINPADEDKGLGGNKLAGKKRVRNALINTVQGRPPQRLFNAEEVARAYSNKSLGRQGRTFTFQGDQYVDGYCIKEYKASQLALEDVQPTLDEITKFSGPNAGDEGVSDKMDLSAIRDAAQRLATTVLQPGDNVEVFEGQQAGVYGVLQSMSGDNVLIKPTIGDITDVIEVPARSVRKRFQTGDHVKVMSGKNIDETGLVLTVDGNTVTFLSDTNQQEITVFAKDLRTAAEVGTSNNMVGNYGLHDFVSLDQTTVGVIFQTGRDSFKVLDQYGTVHTVQPHQITMRRDSKRTLGLDHNRETFKDGDNMVEVEGAGRSGVVLHIYSFTAFLHNRSIKENGGVFVAQCSNLSRPDAVKRGRFQNGAAGMPPHLSALGGPTPNNRGDRRLIGAFVTVVMGDYKGYDGTVKDINGTQFRVEIQSTRKVVNIDQSKLRRKVNGVMRRLDEPFEPGERDWRSGGGFSNNQSSGWGGSGGATPSGGRYGSGGRTPGWGAAAGRTPNPYADGGKTPAWSSSSKTPAWSSSSKTPNPYAQDGGRTPAYNSSRTPNPYSSASGGDAWNTSSKTPNPYAQGGRTPAAGRSGWGGGDSSFGSSWNASNGDSYGGTSPQYQPGGGGYGATPAASAPTPAPDGAPTPYGTGAPTPGLYVGAPTPYVSVPTPFGASTPGPWTQGPYGAPTPAVGGETPAPWGAPTPAVSGGGGGDVSKPSLLGTQDILVKVVPHWTSSGPEHFRGLPDGSTARIISTLGVDAGLTSTASIRVLDSSEKSFIGKEMTIPLDHLEPVRPERGDRAYVLAGELQGQIVKVDSIDDLDVFVTMDSGEGTSLSSTWVAKVYEE